MLPSLFPAFSAPQAVSSVPPSLLASSAETAAVALWPASPLSATAMSAALNDFIYLSSNVFIEITEDGATAFVVGNRISHCYLSNEYFSSTYPYLALIFPGDQLQLYDATICIS